MARHSLIFSWLEPDGGWLGQEDTVAARQRARILDAITQAAAHKGYARATVADIVSVAGVSRRTFYEHFKDKDECFLTAYETGCDALIGNLVAASLAEGEDAHWQDVLSTALDSYLGRLADDPEFARTFLVEILGAGPAAVDLRRRMLGHFVNQYQYLSERAAIQDHEVAPVQRVFLVALVGGIAELVQQHLLEHEAETLPRLQPVLLQLASAVIRGAGVGAGEVREAA